MAETVSTIVQVNTTSAQRSIKSLKDEVSRLNSELDNLTIGSDAYNKKVGDLVDTQKELTAAMDSLNGKTTNYIKAFDSISKVGSGLASGVSSISAAFKLLGGDSEALTKSLGKVTTAIQLVQGLQGLKGLGEGITQSVRAFKALTTTMGTTGRAIQALSGPIGIAAAALGGLLAVLQNIKDNAIQKIDIQTSVSGNVATTALNKYKQDILDQIQAIQNDPTLSAEQKRARIKELKSQLSTPSAVKQAQQAGYNAGSLAVSTNIRTSQAYANALASALGIPINTTVGSAVGKQAGRIVANANLEANQNLALDAFIADFNALSYTERRALLSNFLSSSGKEKAVDLVTAITDTQVDDLFIDIINSIIKNPEGANSVATILGDGELVAKNLSKAMRGLKVSPIVGRVAGGVASAALSGVFAYKGYKDTNTGYVSSADDFIARRNATREALKEARESVPQYGGGFSGTGFLTELETQGEQFSGLWNADDSLVFALLKGTKSEENTEKISDLLNRIEQATGKKWTDLKWGTDLKGPLEFYTDLFSPEDIRLAEQILNLKSEYKKILDNNKEIYNSIKTTNEELTVSIDTAYKEVKYTGPKVEKLKTPEELVRDTLYAVELQGLDIEEEPLTVDYSDIDKRRAAIQNRLAYQLLLGQQTRAGYTTATHRDLSGRLVFTNALGTARNATEAAQLNLTNAQSRASAIRESATAEKALLKEQFNNQLIEYEDYKLQELQITQRVADAELEVENAKNEYLNTQLDERIAKQEAYFAAVQSGLQSTGAIFGNVADLMGKKTDDYKAFAYAETVFNTAASAMAAYKAGSEIPVAGVVLGPLAAASAITAGLVQLKNISEEKISSSSSSSSSIPSLNIGGMNYTRNLLGDRETAELNKDTKVYLVTSELEAYQNKVELRDQASSF